MTGIKNGKVVKKAQPARKQSIDREERRHCDTNANMMYVPIWEKAALTIEEAAKYSNIGITKLYELTNNPRCSFILHVGNRKRLIKRKEFEKYISQNIEI